MNKKDIKNAEKAIRSKLAVAALCMAAGGTALTAAFPVQTYASDKPVETMYLEEPQYAWWETDTLGKWSSVSKAHEYQVRLYIADNVERDEDNWRTVNLDDEGLEAVVTKRISETSCDFAEYMDDLHSYFFVVRATPKVGEQAYVIASGWRASRNVDFRGRESMGITAGKWRNYLAGSKYETEDGGFLPGGWHLIHGSWYLLDENGYRQTGWHMADGKRYHLSEGGQMAVGWFLWNDNWYYAGEDGSIQTGWIMDKPGKYYYLNEDGAMVHDTVVDGYWLDSTGLRQE